MKKVLAAAIVLAVVVVLGPLAIGRFAEPQLNAVLDRVVAQTPYLRVVDRSWQGGWFTSRQQVVLESAVPVGGVARPRFTLQNSVLHGPVLGLSGFGLARVTSRVELSAPLAATVRELFGDRPALQVSTRVGFTGGGTTVLRSEGRTLRLRDGSSTITYDNMKLAADFSRRLDAYELDGSLPRLEVRGSDGSVLQFSRLELDARSSRVLGDLYDTDFDLQLRQLDVAGPGGELTVRDVRYASEMETRKGFTTVSAQIGAGKVINASSQQLGIEIKGVDYDFSLRHLHAETVEKMISATRSVYASLPADADAEVLDSAVERGVISPLRDGLLGLLQHDPELVLEDVGVRTSVGDAKLQGRLKLAGVGEQELQFGFLGALSKAEADFTFAIAEKLAQRVPTAAMLLQAGIAGEYLQREGDRLVARITYRDGVLSINGRQQGVPGLGAPGLGGGVPPGMRPDDAWEP